MNNIRCLQPRIARKFAKKHSKHEPYDQTLRQDMFEKEENVNEMNSLGKQTFLYIYSLVMIWETHCIDDCFGDMEEPLYGFIVEVTVSENQTCQISLASEDNNISQCQLFREGDEDEKEIISGMST